MTDGLVRAVTLAPGGPSQPRIDHIEPPGPPGGVLVDVLAVGVCGTDREIISGAHGSAPPGRDRLVLGHEMLGRVVSESAGLSPGDLVVGIVRRPDPVPCPSCAVGEWDMCRNGRYTERGIAGLDGYMADRIRLDPEFAVVVPPELGDLGVLVEPASVVAKAWEHTEAIGARAHWVPRRVLVTGAGPIGLLAASMAAAKGLEVTVLDRVTEGPKPDLVRNLGAAYHTGSVEEVAAEADVVMECTGAAQVIVDVIAGTAHGAVVCLTGVTSAGRALPVDVGAVSRELVLENDVVFGSVNANRRHYQAAVDHLAGADEAWLEALVTRRVPLGEVDEAFRARPDDVKVVVAPGEGAQARP